MNMSLGNLQASKPTPLFDQVQTRFDEELGILWGYMDPKPKPCFNPQLLEELGEFVLRIEKSGCSRTVDGRTHSINYAVIASAVPGIFNLGGDLALFRKAITARDRDALRDYGMACINNQFPWFRNFDNALTTISLVQGEALGGGFECALSSSVIVAEESARMGFPEVLFNLFPGMGAYSFLVRKIGRRKTEEMITSGNIYTARELLDIGVVDVLTADGTGEAAVYSFVRKHSRSANTRRALETVRNEIEPVTHEELAKVVEIWADAAMRLDARDLRMMDRLLRAQHRQKDDTTDADRQTANVVRLEPNAANA